MCSSDLITFGSIRPYLKTQIKPKPRTPRITINNATYSKTIFNLHPVMVGRRLACETKLVAQKVLPIDL